MKHYSASLEFDAQVDNGDLTITASDALIIAESNTLTDAQVVDGDTTGKLGLTIIGGTADSDSVRASTSVTGTPSMHSYLSGRGRELELKTIRSAFVSRAPAAGSTAGVELTGAQTIYLSYSDLVVSSDLITGATPNASGSIDNTATFFGPGEGFTLSLPEGTTDTNVKQGIFNDTTAGSEVIDFYLDTGNAEGDAEHFNVDVSSFFNDNAFTVPVLNLTGGTAFTDSAISQDQAAAAGSTVTIANDLTVTGDLIVSGDTITANVGELLVEDKYIVANYSTATTTADGGLLVQKAAATASTAGAGLGTHAGIRYNESENVWETSVSTPSGTINDADWTAIGAGAGTVNKFAADITFAADIATVTIAAGTAGTQVNTGGNAALRHGLVQDGDYTISIYEYVNSSGARVDDGQTSVQGRSLIIPENIEIHNTNYGVTITMPAEANSQVFRIVIKA